MAKVSPKEPIFEGLSPYPEDKTDAFLLLKMIQAMIGRIDLFKNPKMFHRLIEIYSTHYSVCEDHRYHIDYVIGYSETLRCSYVDCHRGTFNFPLFKGQTFTGAPNSIRFILKSEEKPFNRRGDMEYWIVEITEEFEIKGIVYTCEDHFDWTNCRDQDDLPDLVCHEIKDTTPFNPQMDLVDVIRCKPSLLGEIIEKFDTDLLLTIVVSIHKAEKMGIRGVLPQYLEDFVDRDSLPIVLSYFC
jgi:hypothetical protein